MLLKITEKIIRRNVFEERKRIPGQIEVLLYATLTFKVCHNHIYLSQEPSNLPPQLLPTCAPNKHIEHILLSSDYS